MDALWTYVAMPNWRRSGGRPSATVVTKPCVSLVNEISTQSFSRLQLNRGAVALADPLSLSTMEHTMWPISTTRRGMLTASSVFGAATLTVGAPAIIRSALAQGVAPTSSMRGGANNYRPGAPIVQRIGNGGFLMSGTVRQAGNGAPLPGIRIQIWAHTTEGYETDARSHGATLTDANGVFRLEMPQIIPAFGQAHGHLAYDDAAFKAVFLRPVLQSSKDKSLKADFVLQSA